MTKLFPQKTMIFEGRKVKIHNKYVFLNPHLIREKKLTWLKVKAILNLHEEKHIVLNLMKDCSHNKRMLRRLAKSITEIEYRLQSAWGFKKDKRYHRFWTLPNCMCPLMDNEDMYPTGYYVINQNCPIHGK